MMLSRQPDRSDLFVGVTLCALMAAAAGVVGTSPLGAMFATGSVAGLIRALPTIAAIVARAPISGGAAPKWRFARPLRDRLRMAWHVQAARMWVWGIACLILAIGIGFVVWVLVATSLDARGGSALLQHLGLLDHASVGRYQIGHSWLVMTIAAAVAVDCLAVGAAGLLVPDSELSALANTGWAGLGLMLETLASPNLNIRPAVRRTVLDGLIETLSNAGACDHLGDNDRRLLRRVVALEMWESPALAMAAITALCEAKDTETTTFLDRIARNRVRPAVIWPFSWEIERKADRVAMGRVREMAGQCISLPGV